jgi:hypothetical protein
MAPRLLALLAPVSINEQTFGQLLRLSARKRTTPGAPMDDDDVGIDAP